jgi:TetR/AcrR family transcriptional repressor of nem operon
MSGRKQYDETAALDAAMKAFWSAGYEATSVQDLERATGLNKSSLYNAYGSKQQLFARCLERFSELYGRRMQSELDAPDFNAAIEGFFGRLVERLEDETLPKGCLATMAAMEFGGAGGEAARRVEANLDGLRDAFAKRCARGVAEGQLPSGTDSDAVAAMLLAMTRGVAVLNRGHSDPGLVRQAVGGMLASLNARS